MSSNVLNVFPLANIPMTLLLRSAASRSSLIRLSAARIGLFYVVTGSDPKTEPLLATSKLIYLCATDLVLEASRVATNLRFLLLGSLDHLGADLA
jgi:hypothetical protein